MSTISNISITGNQLIINYKGTPQPTVSKYRGINFSAYDEGSLTNSNQSQDAAYKTTPYGLCTDMTPGNGSIGGWINNGPFPLGPPKGAGYSKGPNGYIVGGYKAGYPHNKPQEFGSPLQPVQNITGSPFAWATSYPQPQQILNSVKAGVNIARLPFNAGFINQIATGWAKTTNEVVFEANHKYLDYYMTTLDFIVNKNKTTVIFDCHNYMRWCPGNIPGTYSCLAPSGGSAGDPNFVPPRKYSMDHTTDKLCPFKLDAAGVELLNKSMKANWNEQTWGYIKGNSSDNTKLTKGNVFDSFCRNVSEKGITSQDPYNRSSYESNPTGCTSDKLNENKCYGPPTKRIIGIDCFSVLWYNILQSEFNILDYDGNPKGEKQTILSYLKKNEKNIWIDLMNEPSEVNTRDLGIAYGKVIKMFKSLGIKNKLMVEGNYWAGLHAQINPLDEKSGDLIRYGATSEGWAYPNDQVKADNLPNSNNGWQNAPAQILWEEITKANGSNIFNQDNKILYNVHQYLDKYSTGNVGCYGESDSGAKDLESMKFITNFTAFESWAKEKDIKIFCTEFGVPIGNPPDCNKCQFKLNLFTQMLEESSQVEGWTAWRAPPAVSWATEKTGSAFTSENLVTSMILGEGEAEADAENISGEEEGSDNNIDDDICSTSPWTNSIIWSPLNEDNVTNVPTWNSLYGYDKDFTDIKAGKYTLAELWSLKGQSSSSIDWNKYTKADTPVIDSPNETIY